MASKKTIKDGLSFGSDLDDLSFDSFDLGNSKAKDSNKRTPITKITFGAAKGIGRAMTSESTIRNVIAKALPPGYSATVDAAFGISASAKELYHSAADEWEKMAPDARRLVQKIVPHSSRVLPKKLQDKLKNFANGGSSSFQVENPDEAVLRRVMGELEGVGMQERAQSRAEDNAREAIRGQMDGKRHRQNQRILASIDARLAQINAFNDQAFARYQKRSLEIQYRSFFVQRDLLKVQMQSSQDMREAMRAIVHNTALPDMDKLTNSDRVRQGIRTGLRNAASLGVNKFVQNYFGDAKARLGSHLKGMMSGAGSALSMGNMGIEQLELMKEMGMDTTKMGSEMAGGSLMNAIMGHLAGHVAGGFRRSGATAQVGGKLSRLLGNAQSRVANWAGNYDGSLLGQLLLNPLKDILGGKFKENRTIGRTAMREAGDPGMFTKRTQRAIEEVMPEYLSRILHEMQMTRQGPGVKRLVYNEDQNRFTTKSEQSRDLEEGLFNNQNAKLGQESVNLFASKMLGGAKVSDKAYRALQQQIAYMLHNGDELSFKNLQTSGKFIDKKDALELRKAMRGRFRGNMAHGNDKTLLAQMDTDFRGLRGVVQNPMPSMAAMHDMGYTQHLMDAGLVSREGDDYKTNIENFIRRQYTHSADQQRDYSRTTSEDMGNYTDFEAIAKDSANRRDLYKTADAQGRPVIEGRKVFEGVYSSMKTGLAIHLMHDLADGVTLGGRLIATPEAVLKLYFPNGQTYGDWLKKTPRPQSGNGRFARMQNAVHGQAKRFGAFADQSIDKLAGHAKRRGLHTPTGRAAAVSAATTQAKATVAAAVQAGGEHPQVQAAKAKIQSIGNRAEQEAWKALASLKRTWKRVVSAAQYGQSLYERGGTTAVIDEATLRAGEYYSALTNKPITDLRDMVDGVKTRTGAWVVHPEEVLNLETKKGYSFKTLMADLQAGMDQAQVRVQAHVEAAQSSPAGQAVHQAVEAAKAAVNASARSSADTAGAAYVAAAPNETMESLLSVLTAFRDGNLEYLDHILEALHSGPAGTGSAEGKKKLSFMDRMRKTRLGLVGRWGSAAARGAGRATAFGARMYGKYVKGTFGLMGSLAKAPFKMAGWLFGGNKNHRGKVAADVFVGKESKPRITGGGMLAGDYVWVDAKTGKVGGPVTCPADIKGPVTSPDGKVTYISADDLRENAVGDKFGYSVARHVLTFLGKGIGGLAGMYAAIFKVPFKVAAWAGSVVKDLITGRKKAVDIYVRGDTPWLPRVTAMGMQRGMYVTHGKLGMSHTVRSLRDVTGDVYDISNGSPRLVLGPEDFAPPKGLCDIEGKPLHVRQGFLSRVGGGLMRGIGTGLGGLARLGGHMLSAGASLAAMPFRFIKNLLTGQGLVNFNFGGGGAKKGTKTSDERTHDILTEILRMLDGRLPETEHYRRGSWQEALASRGKKGAAGMKGAMAKAGSGIGGLWSRLKGLFQRKKDEDGEDDDDSSTTINNYGDHAGRDAKGRVRGSRGRRAEARRIKALRAKGFRGGALEAELAKGGRFKRLMGRIPGAGRLGGVLGKVGGMGGKVLGHLKGGIGGLLGGLALDEVASRNKGSTLGKVAGGASTALNVAGTAATIASLAGVNVAAGAAAAGSAALSTTAALLSNPVGWAILAGVAVAGAGYLAYKGFNAVREEKKDAPLRNLRIAQYGVDITNNSVLLRFFSYGHAAQGGSKGMDMLKLEALMLPTVINDGRQASIDGKKFMEVENEVRGIFGLGTSGHLWGTNWGYNLKNSIFGKSKALESHEQAFQKWLVWRFRPIFLNWVLWASQVDKSVKFSELDEKLKADQKKALLEKVQQGLNPKVFSVTDSPFDDYPLITGRGFQSMIKDRTDDVKAAIKKQKATEGTAKSKGGVVGAKGVKDKGKQSLLTSLGKGALAMALGPLGTLAMTFGKDVLSKGKALLSSAMKFGKGLWDALTGKTGKDGSTKLAAKANFQSKFAFMGGQLSALQAIRYKTYGLKEFKAEQVKALFVLENDVIDKLDYDAHGVASYSGPVDYWFEHYAGYFGISGSDTTAKARWYSWFSKRFLPTLLQFASAVKKASKNTDPRDADNYLSAVPKLEVANLVIGATYSQDKQSVSVWTMTDSPFDDKPLNNDSKSVNDNLQVLKNDADKITLPSATAKPPTAAGADQGKAPTAQPGMATQVASKMPRLPVPINTQVTASAGGGVTGALGGGTATTVGKPVPQPGGGSGGDINAIPVPSGSGYTALRGTLDAAAKMVGVDPTVLSTFAGIESGYNPGAHAGTSSAAGLGQFLKATWQSMMSKYAKTYGINPATPPTDPRAASIMLGLYIKENASYLKRVLGRDPTDTELYMAHFLGPGGAKELIQMPDNAVAANYMPGPAQSNQPIFYTKGGSAATRAQVVANLDGRVARWRKLVNMEGPATATELATNTTKPGQATPSGIAPPMSTGRIGSIAAAIAGATPAKDPVAASKSMASAKAAAADAQAQATSAASNAQNGALSTHVQAQTDLQRQMVQYLGTIAGHTSNMADGIANITPGGPGANGTASGTDAVTAASASTSTPDSSVLPSTPAPRATVSMRRTNFEAAGV